MRKLTAILLFLLIGINCIAQKSSSSYAIIEFVGENNNNTKTYLGKIKKGNPNRLHDYLQQKSSEENENDYSPKEYRSKKEREKFRHLSDVYSIDEKKLKRKKEKYYQKYLKEKERVYTEEIKKRKRKEKDANRFSIKSFLKREKIPKTKLSKQYKIRGKRLRKGKQLKFSEGNVSLIIKYKVRENNMVRTYVTDVNSRVMAGSKYYLKYTGTDTKRKYFLAKAP